tara:strand:+ start:670 stop:2688 length:2019 start_codon:yes stop_codon:yes gene_type:complete
LFINLKMKKLFSIVLLFCNLTSLAQLSDSLNKTNTLNKTIKEVVITGQLESTSVDNSVHKIRIIDGKTINSGLYHNLADIIQKQLNINLFEDNVLGSSIALQGISGQNVKILIDNVPVIGRLNGNIDLSQINLNNIERIEIVEGPLSTIYGTDALAGTINLISKQGTKDTKQFSSLYESVGRYNFDVFISNNNLNYMSYNFGRKYFNGWSMNQPFSFLPTSQLADMNRVKKWKPKEQTFNKVSYRLKYNDLKIYNYFENFYEKVSNLGKPREPYFETAFDEYYHTKRTNFGSDIKFQNLNDRVNILLAYNKYKREKETYYTDLTTLNKTLVDDINAQDTSEFSLIIGKITISNSSNDIIKYQAGIDLQKSTAKGKRITNNYQEQDNYAFFSFAEYTPHTSVSIRPSFRVIYNSSYKAPLIPSLNLLYNVKDYDFRFSYAKGFRAPDFKELYLNFVDINHNIVGNPLLKAETSENIQFNISFNNQISKTKIKTDINLFHNFINDKIDLALSDSNSDQYSYFNIDKFKTKGISTILDVYYNKINAKIGVSYTGRNNEFNNNNYQFSLDYNLNLSFNILNKTRFNIFYKHTGEMVSYLLENNSIDEITSDSYNLMDISINQKIFSDIILFSFGAKNLFNITDISRSLIGTAHSNTNNLMSVGYGRSFFTELKINL